MRRFIAIVLLVCLCSALYGDALPAYEPYTKDEFPLWSQHLRRGETLFFGSLALTVPLVTLASSLINQFGGNIPTEPALKVFLAQAGVAGVLSLSIALADYFIGRAEEKNGPKN